MPNTYCEGLGEENTDLVYQKITKKLSRDHPYINSTENQQKMPFFYPTRPIHVDKFFWKSSKLESFRSLLLKFQ